MLKLQAALTGSLAEIMAAEVKAAERAVTAGVREATAGLKTELRAQITGAGLGPRLARTWRSEVYPKGRTSIGAAGLVWSKASRIVRVYEDGAVIRSRRGFFLAIPTLAAGRYGDGGKKIAPGLWERMTGLRLRFVFRRGASSLLVADGVRLSRRGRAVANIGRRGGAEYTRLAGRVTVPMFVLVPQVSFRKRLDVAGAARKWIAALPGLVVRNWRDPQGRTR